ncbi:hypothetical protein G6F56_008587 [Rhizopus delemar]|nr:hypothetical protein G6F56_008587 [Rhizopus delemar]
MPTALFKSKLNTIISKLSTKNDRSSKRKLSDTISVGTYDSTLSMADKLRQAFFRSRSSSQGSSTEEISATDYSKELEKLHSLYLLAIEELNFAQDSVGSFYYSGDLLAAREALDDCANVFMQLLENILDPVARENVRSSITPKLIQLQTRLAALPEDKVVEERDEYEF